jgi:transposase-like protein
VEKNENRGTNRHGRRFDDEFKRDAARMLKSGERSAQQLSQELGVSVWSLNRWSKEFPIGEPTGPGALRASEPASSLEIARLRRELEFITRQRDILSLVLSNRGSENLPSCSP